MAVLTAVSALSAAPLSAQDVLMSAQCSNCHQLTPPAPAERTVAALAARNGPDLFYAGSKYRPQWLRKWLTAPKPIRPAGLTPYLHTRTVDGKDQLLATEFTPHPVVPADQIDLVVSALQQLDWGQELLVDSLPAAPPVPRMLAQMNFVKFKGCASCHRISPEFGGLSAPQLYNAAERLRPEFLASYISDPQAWDPVAPMPGYQLPAVEVAKLIHYLNLVNKEYGNATTR